MLIITNNIRKPPRGEDLALRGVTFANPNANPARHRETEGEAEKDEITRPLDLLE